MNTKEIISRLKVLLAIEDKAEETKMKTAATLVDGTEVYVEEGAIEPGNVLYVVSEEGDVLAPEGMHETSEGLLVSVGPDGSIISVEPKAPVEAEKKEDEEEVKAEDEVEENEKPVEEKMADDLLEGMAELLKPFIDEIKSLKEEVEQAKVKMQSIADQPAASRIKHSVQKSAKEVDEIEVKLAKIKQLKNNKK